MNFWWNLVYYLYKSYTNNKTLIGFYTKRLIYKFIYTTMIFINENSLGVVIPKHQMVIQDIFRLELVHQATKQKFVFDNLTNYSE